MFGSGFSKVAQVAALPVIAGFVAAPFLGHLVESYQAVVVDIRQDSGEVQLIDEHSIVEWREIPFDGKPEVGQFLKKDPFEWDAKVVADCDAAPDLERWAMIWTEAYEGMALAVEEPPSGATGLFGGSVSARVIIGTRDGRKIDAGMPQGDWITPGTPVLKRKGTWNLRRYPTMEDAAIAEIKGKFPQLARLEDAGGGG